MTDTNVTPETEALATSVKYGDFELSISDMSPKTTVYLLQYGFGKSCQDSVAGLKKEMTAEKNEDGTAKWTEAQIAAKVKEVMGERVKAIADGTIGNRGPGKPKLTTREALIEKIVRERLTAAAAKQNKKLPKVGEGYEALAEKYLAAKKADVEAEADRRLAFTADAAEDFDFNS